MLDALMLMLHNLPSKYLYRKFGSMMAVMWRFPKFTTIIKLASQQRKTIPSHVISFNHIHSYKRQKLLRSQGFQQMAISLHTYQYSTKTNIYFAAFQLVLVPYSLETSKLSYVQFNLKLGWDSSILSKIVNYTKIPF